MSPTPTAPELARLMGRVLKRPGFGTDDDFFLAGGDSRAALVLMAWVEDRWHLDPPVTLLFDAPTAGALAQAMQELRPASSRVGLQAQEAET